jgi:hypothetical protein
MPSLTKGFCPRLKSDLAYKDIIFIFVPFPSHNKGPVTLQKFGPSFALGLCPSHNVRCYNNSSIKLIPPVYDYGNNN